MKRTTFFEYRLRWEVDDQGNFLEWEEPQLLGDS